MGAGHDEEESMKKAVCSLFLTAVAALTQIPVHAQSAVQIPAGSIVEATLLKALDAKKSKVGDEVTAKVTRDLKAGDQVLIARNSKIVGHLTDVKAKSKDQAQSLLVIGFDRAVLKDGGELPLNVTIQALGKPVDDRTLEVSDALRGTSPNTSAGTLGVQPDIGGHGRSSSGLTPQSQGVVGYSGIGLQDSTVYSPNQNVHLDGGTQMILQVSGK